MRLRFVLLFMLTLVSIMVFSGCAPKASIAPTGEGYEIVLQVKPGKSDKLRSQYAELVLAEQVKRRLKAIGVNKSSVEVGKDATVIVRTSALEPKRAALFASMIGEPLMLALKVVPEKLDFKSANDGDIFMAGKYVKSAEVEKDPFGKKYLMLRLNAAGAKRFAEYTARQRGKRVSVTIDGWAFYNTMIYEKIQGGGLILKGFSSDEQMEALKEILPAGPYSEDVEVVSLMGY